MKSNWRDYLNDIQFCAIPTLTDFRGINQREIVVFKGVTGWSEFSPFVEYGDEECKNWLRAAVEGAYFAWPELKNDLVPINATLPKINTNDVAKFLNKFNGAKTIKIKINSFAQDKDLVVAAMSAQPNAKIRLDVNGMWSYEIAVNEMKAFADLIGDQLEYFEQPVTSHADLKKLCDNLNLPIAIDEGIRKNLNGDLSKIKLYGHRAIIKWQPCGGFENGIALGRSIDMPITVSSALESSIGISHGLVLAAYINESINIDFNVGQVAAGLGTVALLAGDLICDPFVVKDGHLKVKRVELNLDKTAQHKLDKIRTTWWHERIDRVWSLISEKDIETWGWDFL